MANVKISNLTAATTPVAGTEVLPIVQSGATVKVSIANLTAGRSVSATGLALAGSTSGTVTLAAKAVAGSTTFRLPAADGTSNQAMVTDGSGNLSFATIGATPGGSTTQVQYNNAGAFAGSANLVFDGTNLTSAGTVTATKFIPTGSSATGTGVYSPASNSVGVSTNGAERSRIDSSGRQYFFNAGSASTVADCIFNFAGTFGANRGISVNATDSATSMDAIYFTTQSTYRGAIVCSSGGTAYNTSSDYRLKNTIAPMTGALARVAALKPCTYKWNADGADGEGFIAHELAEVCPSAVTGEKDAVDADGNIKPQGIDTSFLVATLTAAIQEQQALITQLQADVAALKGS